MRCARTIQIMAPFSHRKIILALVSVAMFGLILSLWYSVNRTSNSGRFLLYGFHLPAALNTSQQTAIITTTPKPRLLQLTPSGMPKLVHFIYRDRNVLMPYRDAFETCTRFNKDWLFVLWTDDAIRTFIRRHFPGQVKSFDAFPHKIQRADAIRYLILYKFGGIYMDLDMHCHRPLLPVLSTFSCFIDRERQHQTQYLHGRQYSAMNSAMGCTPGHPFFRKIIDFVFHPDRIRGGFSFPETIFQTTGPAMLTNIYDQWQRSKSQPSVTMLNETYFSPLINPRSGIYGACRHRTRDPKASNRSPMSHQDRVCWELKNLGFENSDKLFTTNRTVAIHQFTHLGYYNQQMNTFNVTKDFPQVASYYKLDNFLNDTYKHA